MKNSKAFPFQTMMEAWDVFDQVAEACFIRIVEQQAKIDPDLLLKIKILRNKDYCARLMYILNMFAYEGDQDGEFDLDWALLLARPLSAAQARQSLEDLVKIGLMTEINHEITRNIPKRLQSGMANDKMANPGTGGYSGTKFNFS